MKQQFKTLLRFGLICLLVMVIAGIFTRTTQAATIVTYIVNDVTDLSDANTSDGICDTLPGTVGNQCSLRAAIQQANAHPEPLPGPYIYQIHFDLGFIGPYTIQPNSALPVITKQVIIDGSTQPGSSCPGGENTPADLRVILDGQNAGSNAIGLKLDASGSVVKGLVIGNFGNAGINGQNPTILCNHIGVDVEGDDPMPNKTGIILRMNGIVYSVVGGGDVANRNVISGNTNEGILVQEVDSAERSIRIFHNFIGTSADGLTAIGNGSYGIYEDILFRPGVFFIEDNVISGNGNAGIRIAVDYNELCSGCSIVTKQGAIKRNKIGTSVSVTTALPNLGHGIHLESAPTLQPAIAYTIGGVGNGNLIGYNSGSGIHINLGDHFVSTNVIFDNNNGVVIEDGTSGNDSQSTIRFNKIYDNINLGIDLGFDGVTPNDGFPDNDSGANNLQNFPIITSVSASGGNIVINGNLTSEANTNYTIDLFSSDTCNLAPNDYGQGKLPLNVVNVTTNNMGYSAFSVSSAQAIPEGSFISAIATKNSNEESSEFSKCVIYTNPNSFEVNQVGDSSDLIPGNGSCDVSAAAGLQCTLRAALQEVQAQPLTNAPFTINFNIPGNGPHTIIPNQPLPKINAPVIIDGTSEPLSACPKADGSGNDLRVVIDGSNLTNEHGLELTTDANNSVIRGLAIINFGGDAGIFLDRPNNVYLGCNRLEANKQGVLLEGSSTNSATVVVGGLSPIGAERNFFSGNQIGFETAYLGNSGVVTATLTSNGFGFPGKFTATEGNLINAIKLSTSNNYLVGNSVFYSGQDGILISGNSHNNKLFFNNIGGDGVTIWNNNKPNGRDGIRLVTTANGEPNGNLIGDESGGYNWIVNNVGNGITIESPTTFLFPINNVMRYNRIANNGGLGIDLGTELGMAGVSPNDGGAADDSDIGPNGLVNFPTLTAAFTDGFLVTTTISYDGKPNTVFAFDIYLNESCDASGNGEGLYHYYSDGFLTSSGGGSSATVDFSAPSSAGKYLVALVTHPTEGTSEFSTCRLINDIRQFTVNDIGNGVNGTADGNCDAPGVAQCTLREAIMEANAAPYAPITIDFNIPGGGPHQIDIGSPLVFNNRIILDATTQPGANCPGSINFPGTVLVGIYGSNGAGIFLDSGSDGSEIRGLAIYAHDDDAVQIKSNNNWLACNYIGLDEGGLAVGNGLSGIIISSSGNLIGGDVSGQRNVIGANFDYGIHFTAGADENYVYGNFIGLGPDGDANVGNGNAGIRLNGATNNVIGGILPSWGNYVGFNNSDNVAGNGGISLVNNSNGNLFQKNVIGADITNAADSGNIRYGIHINDSSNNIIGGENKGNTIVNNGFDGITIINAGTGNHISQNSITDNGGLGIDLNDNGFDPIDNDDIDTGPNNVQNRPTINDVEVLNSKTNIDFNLNTAPNKNYTLEFFASATCNNNNPLHYGEGEIYLGSETVNTDSLGLANGQATVNVMNASYLVTATATDNATGDTSEFSQCFIVCNATNTINPIISLQDSDVLLNWSDPIGDEIQYNIYNSENDPYNVNSLEKQTTDLFAEFLNLAGDPTKNLFFAITVDRTCGESEPSQTMGVFNFAIVPGTP